MALIDNNMAAVGTQIRDNARSNQALNEGDIDASGRFLLPATDDAEAVRRDVQKCWVNGPDGIQSAKLAECYNRQREDRPPCKLP